MEWTEEMSSDRKFPWADGAPVFAFEDYLVIDRVDQMAMERPWVGGIWMGLRVASAVPAPHSVGMAIVAVGWCMCRHRRNT